MRHRRVLGATLAGVLAAAGLAAGCSWPGHDASGCGHDETVVDDPPAVFGPVGSSNDKRLEKLAATVTKDGFGPVVAGVGYDYDRWLSVGPVATGLAVWTRHDPVISFLDEDLSPVWGLRQAKVPHAWTADDDTFFQLELSPEHPLWLSAYRLADGHREWCASVGERPTRNTDRYGTAMLSSGVMVVLARGRHGAELTALDTASGKERWARPIRGIDRGDFVGDLGGDTVLVGGRASFEMGRPEHPRPEGASLTAVDAGTGKVRWRYRGGEVHVVGRSGGVLVIEQLTGRGLTLVGLGTDGRVHWRRPAKQYGYDVAATTDMVVANTGSAFVGIDPATGRWRWRTPYRKVPQYLPYGFVLAAQPMLDMHRVLVAGTDALHALDVRTGRMWDYPLPTDGVSTTYWPYQVTVADRLLTVVTNTGAVVVDRDLA